MTDLSHLNALLAEETGALRKSLVEEFTRIVRDPDVPAASYAPRLRAIMEAHLQATDGAPA